MPTTQTLRDLDKKYLWHPFTHMQQWLADDPLVIIAGDGMELIDSDGQRYLDGVSSLWCNVHGHRVAEIDQAIRDQLDKIAHSTMLGLASQPAIELAARLMSIVPNNLSRIFYSDAGATAAEIAFKLAVQYWHNRGRGEKNQFIGLTEAYHGDTTGSMSVGRTTAFHRPYFPLLFQVHFAPTPFVYRFNGDGSAADAQQVRDACLNQMRQILQQHHQNIAAVCVEPIVQGAAGMIIQPTGYLAGVRALCDEYDVLLICDEVATGFGRTGRMFACEHEQVQPDLMCVAKGITGGYLPLAATFATDEIFQTFLGQPEEGRTFYHGHTYTGNPLACAAALASLDLFAKHDLVNQVQHKASILTKMLQEISPLQPVGEIRQKGLMVGIELVADRAAKKPFDPRQRVGAQVCTAIRRHGVIIRPLGDTLVLMPPLAMPIDDLQRIVDAVKLEISRL
ncbi:MAG: adenosylmethionine--8-amino-7-oxononanoate transaminase [Phycisphaerales bacterium]|nr:adenosylmethionine--8-amino-7-oxononanoate transaminase [Phycisphaerales bacterium]